uniref:Uncharacterized protein n=1 Tax=Rhizophora mucronata TaxID=61149 RepID=A0A2P2QVT5_RHIMU
MGQIFFKHASKITFSHALCCK